MNHSSNGKTVIIGGPNGSDSWVPKSMSSQLGIIGSVRYRLETLARFSIECLQQPYLHTGDALWHSAERCTTAAAARAARFSLGFSSSGAVSKQVLSPIIASMPYMRSLSIFVRPSAFCQVVGFQRKPPSAKTLAYREHIDQSPFLLDARHDFLHCVKQTFAVCNHRRWNNLSRSICCAADWRAVQ